MDGSHSSGCCFVHFFCYSLNKWVSDGLMMDLAKGGVGGDENNNNSSSSSSSSSSSTSSTSSNSYVGGSSSYDPALAEKDKKAAAKTVHDSILLLSIFAEQHERMIIKPSSEVKPMLGSVPPSSATKPADPYTHLVDDVTRMFNSMGEKEIFEIIISLAWLLLIENKDNRCDLKEISKAQDTYSSQYQHHQQCHYHFTIFDLDKRQQQQQLKQSTNQSINAVLSSDFTKLSIANESNVVDRVISLVSVLRDKSLLLLFFNCLLQFIQIKLEVSIDMSIDKLASKAVPVREKVDFIELFLSFSKKQRLSNNNNSSTNNSENQNNRGSPISFSSNSSQSSYLSSFSGSTYSAMELRTPPSKHLASRQMNVFSDPGASHITNIGESSSKKHRHDASKGAKASRSLKSYDIVFPSPKITTSENAKVNSSPSRILQGDAQASALWESFHESSMSSKKALNASISSTSSSMSTEAEMNPSVNSMLRSKSFTLLSSPNHLEKSSTHAQAQNQNSYAFSSTTTSDSKIESTKHRDSAHNKSNNDQVGSKLISDMMEYNKRLAELSKKFEKTMSRFNKNQS